jgi:hypothetical protein
VALAAADRATDVAEAPPPSITSPPDVRDADEPSRPGAATGDTRDVGALFEQLRSEQAPTPGAVPDAAAAAPEAAGEPTAEPAAESEAPSDASDASDASDDPDAEPPLEGNAALLRARDDALAPVADDVARRAKRTLQDEQNDVLDGLRRQRGKIDMEKILPAADEQLTRWAHVLQPAVDRAYAAGAASVASAGGGADAAAASVSAALLAELAGVTVTPLRERLESSLATVDTRSPADMEIAVAQALGARYREWRAQDLEMALGDVLTVAYARGVHDAAPEGSQLRWIPAREGKCPDCDDNALEPTARGSTFPTGQAYPPAHPGCRCLLVLDAHT